ncbi:MAG: FkbM family methyltransferase [Thermoproteota archaeon]
MSGEESEDFLEWLVRASHGCIPDEDVARLKDGYLMGCNILDVRVRGQAGDWVRAVLPCNDILSGWANLVHVFCLDDYRARRVFDGDERSVLDVGAYLGFFSVLASRLAHDEALLIAVEPNPHVLPFLYENLRVNGLESRARVDPRAIGLCEECVETLYVPAPRSMSSMVRAYLRSAGLDIYEEIKVRAVSLKRLMDNHGLRSVDVLKLDVEGLEQKLLENWLREGLLDPSFIRKIVVEVHKPVASLERVAKLISVAGYSYEAFDLGGEWLQAVVVGEA